MAPRETGDDATMEDAPPSHQPTANEAEEADVAGDDEMNEDVNYEEEEEEEPQRVKLVCCQDTSWHLWDYVADPPVATWFDRDCCLI
jgi:hypothetical protein